MTVLVVSDALMAGNVRMLRSDSAVGSFLLGLHAEDRRIGLYSVLAVSCIARLYTRALYGCIAIQIRGTNRVRCIGPLRAVLTHFERFSIQRAIQRIPIMKPEIS